MATLLRENFYIWFFYQLSEVECSAKSGDTWMEYVGFFITPKKYGFTNTSKLWPWRYRIVIAEWLRKMCKNIY